jgi:uncharacterized membrane protein
MAMLLDNAFHPLFSHAPLTITALVVIYYLYSFVTKKRYPSLETILLLLLCISAALSFATGWFAQETAGRSFTVPEDAIAEHFKIARITLVLSLCTLSFHGISKVANTQKKQLIATTLFVITLLALIFSVFATSHAGGKLVYTYGAGISKL